MINFTHRYYYSYGPVRGTTVFGSLERALAFHKGYLQDRVHPENNPISCSIEYEDKEKNLITIWIPLFWD